MSDSCSCICEIRLIIKHFPCFYAVIETRVEVWENENTREHEGTRARRASASKLFLVLPKFHECFYKVWNTGKNVFYFFYKINRRKQKRGNTVAFFKVRLHTAINRADFVSWCMLYTCECNKMHS